MSKLHLGPAYQTGIDFEVANELITNEIGWQFARAHAHGYESAKAAPYRDAISDLLAVRSMLRVDSPETVEIATRLVRSMQRLHALSASDAVA